MGALRTTWGEGVKSITSTLNCTLDGRLLRLVETAALGICHPA